MLKLDRYKQIFGKLNRLKEGALIPFTVIGDPDYKTSLDIIKVLSNRGDILELGLPFSDPIADGSTIQKADVRALKHSFNTNKIFDFLKKARKFTDKPIGLLVYYNLIYQYGLERFCSKAKESGVDSILVADLSLEESDDFVKVARKNNIATVFLVTQLTNTKRLRKILKKSKGFVYIVNVLGVTGIRVNLENNQSQIIKSKITTSPKVCTFKLVETQNINNVVACNVTVKPFGY